MPGALFQFFKEFLAFARREKAICFEPMLIAGNQGYFVEDTILITHDGHEVLNPQLPYAPDEIERAIAKRRPR